MTTRQALNDLADRCEAATGADRELFVEAFIAVYSKADPARSDAAEWISALSRFSRVLDASAFLDAAMVLVPSGHEWSVNWAGNSAAIVATLPDGPEYAGVGDTPALALTAAALRARAAMESGDQDAAS